MHLLVHDIVPNTFQGRNKCRISPSCHDIRHARIKVHGPHRMAFGSALFAYRQVLLGVPRCHSSRSIRPISHPTYINEFLCHIQIQFIARHLIKLDQSQFYLLMPRSLIHRNPIVVIGVTFEEHLIDVLCILLRHIQPFPFASSPIVRHCPFVHVTHVVELMTMYHERIRLVTGSPTYFLFRRSRKNLVQIPIRALGFGDDVDDVVHLFLQFRIFLECQQIGCPLHYFEQIRCHITRQ